MHETPARCGTLYAGVTLMKATPWDGTLAEYEPVKEPARGIQGQRILT